MNRRLKHVVGIVIISMVVALYHLHYRIMDQHGHNEMIPLSANVPIHPVGVIERLKTHALISYLKTLPADNYKTREKFINVVRSLLGAKASGKLFWKQLDIMNLPPFTLDPEFRNPCWRSNAKLKSCRFKRQWWQLKEKYSDLRCLPYFLIIGQAKCGTTDIWSKVISHPDIVAGVKENWWLCQARITYNCASIDTYLGMFQGPADIINRHHKPGTINPYVTGEATPDTFSTSLYWDLLPGNEYCAEPRITNAHMLRHIQPEAKLILTLRNPIERIYSWYLHRMRILKRNATQENFHKLVKEEIKSFKECLKSRTLRACCYDYVISGTLTENASLRRSIYYVFLVDWLKVFPRQQIHILRFEDYAANTTYHLSQIFNFLGLRALNKKNLQNIVKAPIRNQKKKSQKMLGGMWNSTRQVLQNFLKPYTKMLGDLLNDKKFLWTFA